MRMKTLRNVLAGALAAAALSAGAQAGELVYGAGIPAKSEEITLGAEKYAEAVKDMSKGALTIKVLAGAQLVSLQNTLANLREGTIDVGFVVPAFTRKELKHVNVLYDTEVFGTDPAAITGAVNETILLHCPDCLKDFRDNGALFLGGYGNTDKGLICRKPVKTLADVKGLKIRALGSTSRLIADMGATPVVMGPPESATALQNGTIDCVHGPMIWLKNFGYWDVAKYMLETPLGSPRPISSVVYSRRAWDKMSDAEKRIAIDAVPGHLAGAVYDVNVAADRRIKEIAIKEHGIHFTEGGQDFHDLLAAYQKKEMVAIPKIGKETLGAANADEIFATFMKALEKWEKIAKDSKLKEDKAAMTAIYKKEIYDKVDLSKL